MTKSMILINFFFTLLVSSAVFAENKFKSCVTPTDCLVVRDGWCHRVSSINRANLKAWEKQDEDYVTKAKGRKQECKPAMGPELEIKNYKADCQNQSCQAVFLNH